MLRTKHAVVGVVLILGILFLVLIAVLFSKWKMENQPAPVAAVGIAVFSNPRDSYEVNVVTPNNVQHAARESLVEKLEALPRPEPVVEDPVVPEPIVEESFTTPLPPVVEETATTTQVFGEGLE